MSNFLDSLDGDLLAAHLTLAVRHAWSDDIPATDISADDVAADDKLLFGLLRSALTRSPPANMAEYAQRLAKNVCPGPDFRERLA